MKSTPVGTGNWIAADAEIGFALREATDRQSGACLKLQ
jgi:hypothetical protein